MSPLTHDSWLIDSLTHLTHKTCVLKPSTKFQGHTAEYQYSANDPILKSWSNQIKSIGGFWGEWKTGIPVAKTLGKEWTSNKLRRLLTPSLGVKRRTNWWEANPQKDGPVPLPPLHSPHPSRTTVGNWGTQPNFNVESGNRTRDKRVLSPLLIWTQRVVLCFEWC